MLRPYSIQDSRNDKFSWLGRADFSLSKVFTKGFCKKIHAQICRDGACPALMRIADPYINAEIPVIFSPMISL